MPIIVNGQITLAKVADGVDGRNGIDGKDGYTPIKGVDYFDGVDGQNGSDGADGKDGVSSYLWVRYSQNADGSGMTTNPTGAKYIGTATTSTPSSPAANTSYNWTLIKGTDGLKGEDGTDGRSSYLHIKYSNDGGVTFTGNNGEDVGEWIGTYVDFNSADSTSVSAYTWNKVKGEKGEDGYTPIKGVDYFDGKDGTNGKDGSSSYLWVKYSVNANGNPMTDSPSGALYVGIATTTTASAPTSYSAYKWSLIKGTDGIDGENGSDGRTSYLHIKYSNDGGTTFTANTGETVGDYIGTYVDFTQADSTNPSSYTWNKVKGEKGDAGYTPVKGVDYFDGKDGTNGTNGTSSYLWVRYSQASNGNPMTTDPSGAKYVGIATTTTATAPTGYSSYKWSLIKGTDGLKGEDGVDGQSSYLHIKYSNDGGATFTANSGETVGTYIGTYVDFVQADSTNVSAYTWNKVKGDKGDKGDPGIPGYTPVKGIDYFDGEDGQNATERYTWVKYADTATGTGMSDSPTGKKYIGFAYNKTSATESNTASDYTWSLIQGEAGKDGVDGKTYYTWVKYATSATGTSMSDSPDGKTYIGLAYNKTTATESTNAADYTWSLIKGADGKDGTNGTNGKDGVDGKDGKPNLVNNPNYTGTTEGWTAGASVTAVDKAFVDGSTIKMLQGVSSGNSMFRHTYVDVDSSKMYEITVWLLSSSTAGRNYVGHYAYDSNDAQIGSYPINKVTGTKTTTPDSNPYGHSYRVPKTTWEKVTFYLLPAGLDISDKELVRNLGENNDFNFQMAANTKKISLRWLNWSNTASRTLWCALPLVQEVNLSVLEANRAKNLADQTEAKINNAVTTIDGTGVSVKDGNFSLEQTDNSGVWRKYYFDASDNIVQEFDKPFRNHLINHQNLVADHSFEMIERDVPFTADGWELWTVKPEIDSFRKWAVNGQPKLQSYYQTDVTWSRVPFGQQMAVVDDTNNFHQSFSVGALKTYTLSFHVNNDHGRATGQPKITIRFTDELGYNLYGDMEFVFPKPESMLGGSQEKAVRHALTITTAGSLDEMAANPMMEVYFESTVTGYWVSYDGIQLVEFDKPVDYTPEETAFMTRRGVDKYRPIDSLGEGIRVPEIEFAHGYKFKQLNSGYIHLRKADDSDYGKLALEHLHTTVGFDGAGGRITSKNTNVVGYYGFSGNGWAKLQKRHFYMSSGGSIQFYYDFNWESYFSSGVEWVSGQTIEGNSVAYNVGIYSITRTGARAYLAHIHNSAATVTVQVQVVALGD
jgi:hypothetical protein